MLLGFYWPFRDEIGPHGLIRPLIEQRVRSALPVVVEKNQLLEFWVWRPGQAVGRGVWSILIPAERRHSRFPAHGHSQLDGPDAPPRPPLAGLVGVWLIGRFAVSTSGWIGAGAAAVLDLSFLALLLAVVLREIVTGRNWRNLPIPVVLAGLLTANAPTHAEVSAWRTPGHSGSAWESASWSFLSAWSVGGLFRTSPETG